MPLVTRDGKREEVWQLEEIKEKLNKLEENDEKIIDLIERGKIRLDAHISKILDRVDLTQDSYDALMKLLRDYGKKRGLL